MTIVWIAAACALVVAAAQAQAAAAAVAREAPLARGAFAHGAPLRAPRPLLRVRRGPGLSGRRRAGAHRRRAPGGLHAPGGSFRRAKPEERRPDRRRHAMPSPICNSPAVTAFPISSARFVRRHLAGGAFVESSSGVTLTDVDGNRLYDVTGSYGVNVFGYDFYKECIARGSERVRDLGPVLGSYHPVVAYNVRRLLEISGMDEVSFHMSGTEAVMQAVRLARYHTRRSHLVRFCGAYHGWWGDVQPGVGNPVDRTRDLHLARHGRRVAARAPEPARHRLRAGQSAAGAASELQRAGRFGAPRQRPKGPFRPRGLRALARAAARRVRRARHRADLRRGIRRLQARTGRRPGDISGCAPTWSPTARPWRAACPSGVLCGRRAYMRRFREDRPADICFARGTFNSHPYVMGAMCEFLERLESADIRRLYDGLDDTWNARASESQRATRGRASAGAGRESVDDMDDPLRRSRRATTGCFNITYARPASP